MVKHRLKKIYINLLTALLLFVGRLVAGAAEPDTEERLREVIRQSGAEMVGLALHDLETGRRILINERVSIHAASTMKVPVMMEVFRRVGTGKLDLNNRVRITDRFSSIVDRSEYRLTPESDSDKEIYRQIGQEMTIRELVERMITISSNLATNILIDLVQPESVRILTNRLGARDIQVRRGVEDTKAFRAGLNNTTTAYDLLILLKAIADCPSRQLSGCSAMIDILAAQKFNDALPAGLPPGTRVAHKTGEITRHHHDAAIVFPGPGTGRARQPRRPYILIVLTRGIEERERSSRLIAELASIVHQHVTGDRSPSRL
jgi:beta-lactamase class A